MSDLRYLLRPLTGVWAWQLLGACRDLPAELFFHPQGERGLSRSLRERTAKNVCSGCAVRAECLAHALSTRESYGVWGGTSPEERELMVELGDDAVG